MMRHARTAAFALSWIVVAALATVLPARTLAADAADAAYDPGMHPGPAVWIEEYWDIKPERLDDFVKTYRGEVYSLTRRIPGYRGYTVITNLQDAQGRPRRGKAPDRMITTHYGIFMQGKILTERAVDIGNLLRQTHNVIVIHHLRDWRAAAGFRREMERLYAKEHDGADLWDHLSAVLFPLANNYWETTFRMAETGLDAGMARPGNDADGLDLEPRPSSKGWYKEYFDVPPEKLERFFDVYRNNTLKVMKPLPGYEGVTFVTTLPPGGDEAKRTGWRNELLGGPDEFFVPQRGVRIDGKVRTDTAVNYSMLFRKTFTVITYFQLPWDVDMLAGMQKNFELTNPGEDRLKHVTQVFFPLSNNHWDMFYRCIETSFVPAAALPRK